MTRSRWFRPVVGLLAAIAVGVGACLVAAHFAAPPALQVISVKPLATVPSQVLDPLTAAQVAQPVDASTASDPSQWSPSAGTIPVVAEPYDGVAPADQALITAMDDADDPAEAQDDSAGLPNAADFGVIPYVDPCVKEASPAPGTTPPPSAPIDNADCPDDGIRSVVLPNVFDTALATHIRAYPPTYADDPQADVSCSTEQNPSAGAVPIGVAAMSPSHYDVSWSPLDGSHSDYHHITFDSSAGDIATWQRSQASARGYVWARTCTEIPGLTPGVQYQLNVRATRIDPGGRLDDSDVASNWTEFTVGSNQPQPPTRVLPFGHGLLYVTNYHESDVQSKIVARIDTDGSHSCTGAVEDFLTPQVNNHEEDVDYGWLVARSYSTEFQKRATEIFYVPEGSRIVLCITQQKSDAPSWTASHPYRTETYVINSPDRIVPKISVDQASTAAGVSKVTIGAATPEGQDCGVKYSPDGTGRPYQTDDLLGVLCDSAGFVGHKLGTDGDINLSMFVTAEGTDYRTNMTLPLSRDTCYGVCALPARAYYTVPLGTVTVHRGICTPDCQAQTVAAGSLRVDVEWEQGNQNGFTNWSIDRQPPPATVSTHPTLPQLDVSQTVTLHTYADGRPTDRVNAVFQLVADRPVDYVVTLTGSTCRRSDTTTEQHGTTAVPVEISFGNLCFGARYTFDVKLTDDAGNTITYSRFGANPWYNGYAWTPTDAVPIHLTLKLTGASALPAADNFPRVITSAVLYSSGHRIGELSDDLIGRCFNSTVDLTVEADRTLPISDDGSIEVRVSWVKAGNVGERTCGTRAPGDPTVTSIEWGYPGSLFFETEHRIVRLSGDQGPFGVVMKLDPQWFH